MKSSKKYYDMHPRKLPNLPAETQITLQNVKTGRGDMYCVVVHNERFQKYFDKTESGRVLERNRRFLRKRNLIMPIA